MASVAILGAGERGAAIAHALACRARISDVLIIDDKSDVAAGKALDIRQSGPIDRSDVPVTASGDLLAASGAVVIVLADSMDGGEWRDDRGLAAIDRLKRAGSRAAFVFAGPNQTPLMLHARRELDVAADRLVGSAASAVVGTVRSLVGLETGGSGVNVSIAVGGRPPHFVVGWSSATVDGALVTDRVPAHRLLAISQSLRRFWPPSPRAVAAPTALIVEALVAGSRRAHQAVTILDGPRPVAALRPLMLGEGRVLSIHTPSFSPQERTEVETAVIGESR